MQNDLVQQFHELFRLDAYSDPLGFPQYTCEFADLGWVSIYAWVEWSQRAGKWHAQQVWTCGQVRERKYPLKSARTPLGAWIKWMREVLRIGIRLTLIVKS